MTFPLISIHASRMGCDPSQSRLWFNHWNFNPRIPYGMRQLFKLGCQPRFDFNPRIPYGMRRSRETGGMQSPKISIHASRMGCDAKRRYHSGWSGISIHASRMGCDPSSYCDCPSLSNFNPRIPYGMRHVAWRDARLLVMISIHASRMGCDDIAVRVKDRIVISIHASRMGCDSGCRCRWPCRCHFNPRIPYGMRRIVYSPTSVRLDISIHASRMGCDHHECQ